MAEPARKFDQNKSLRGKNSGEFKSPLDKKKDKEKNAGHLADLFEFMRKEDDIGEKREKAESFVDGYLRTRAEAEPGAERVKDEAETIIDQSLNERVTDLEGHVDDVFEKPQAELTEVDFAAREGETPKEAIDDIDETLVDKAQGLFMVEGGEETPVEVADEVITTDGTEPTVVEAEPEAEAEIIDLGAEREARAEATPEDQPEAPDDDSLETEADIIDLETARRGREAGAEPEEAELEESEELEDDDTTVKNADGTGSTPPPVSPPSPPHGPPTPPQGPPQPGPPHGPPPPGPPGPPGPPHRPPPPGPPHGPPHGPPVPGTIEINNYYIHRSDFLAGLVVGGIAVGLYARHKRKKMERRLTRAVRRQDEELRSLRKSSEENTARAEERHREQMNKLDKKGSESEKLPGEKYPTVAEKLSSGVAKPEKEVQQEAKQAAIKNAKATVMAGAGAVFAYKEFSTLSPEEQVKSELETKQRRKQNLQAAETAEAEKLAAQAKQEVSRSLGAAPTAVGAAAAGAPDQNNETPVSHEQAPATSPEQAPSPQAAATEVQSARGVETAVAGQASSDSVGDGGAGSVGSTGRGSSVGPVSQEGESRMMSEKEIGKLLNQQTDKKIGHSSAWAITVVIVLMGIGLLVVSRMF